MMESSMYSKLPNLVIGFHGCDFETYKNVLVEHRPLKKSDNKWDWLGNGIYFWENSYERAYNWAVSSKKIETPAVIGAVIDLGNCLNLTDYKSTEILRRGYDLLKINSELLEFPMPENKNVSENKDLLLRNLDCAVIQQIHEYNRLSNQPAFDSVRGVFIEGKSVFPGSGFKEKTHIQIAIANPNCIKGYFKPLPFDHKFAIP